MADFGTELIKWEVPETNLFVSVIEYRGSKKVQINRIASDGVFLKVGRLTADEAIAISPLILRAGAFCIPSTEQ